MKNPILFVAALLFSSSLAQAQLKKDGTPDMRYRANQQTHSNSYSAPGFGSTNSDVDYQSSYQRNGTQVDGSYHTKSNGTNINNWSTTGNTNPLTGSQGTRARDYSDDAYKYGQSQTIQTGPRGGQYYENSNGNRTYVPKRLY